MSTSAIVMLVLFIVIIWGGMILSMLGLRGKIDEEEGDLGTLPGTTDAELIVRGH